MCACVWYEDVCALCFLQYVCDIFSVACGDAMISILQYVGQLVARREKDDAKAKKGGGRVGGGSRSKSELPLDIC